MRVFKDVYLVGGGAYGYSHSSDCNIYVVDGGSEVALIDTGGGLGIEKVIGNVARDGINLNRIRVAFNTHCHFDHIGGNKKIKELTGCKIAAHESVTKSIETLDELTLANMALQRGIKIEPTSVEERLKDNDKIQVGTYSLEVVHTPGHTPGSICLFTQIDEKRVLFSGDTVSARGRLGYINGPGFKLEEWKYSLKRLLDLNIDTMFPGHGTFLVSGAKDHIRLYSDKMNAPWTNIITAIG